MQGYIKLYRQMLKWEWYTNIPVRVLFGHCLLKANHKDSKWQGYLIKKGAFITSQPHLAKETGLSVMQVRTALNKLKLTGEITVNTTSQFSIIAVNNWDKFQDDSSQDNSQVTGGQQADNRRITTNNNDKNDKNDKNIFFIEPTKKEILDFASTLCKRIDADEFIAYWGAANWRDKDGLYVNWKQKVISWVNRHREPEKSTIEEQTEIINKLREQAKKEGRI